MVKRAEGIGNNFLNSSERELLASEGAERVMSAYVVHAAGRLALELGLADEVGLPFVDAFRALPTSGTSDTLGAAAEIASAIDRLKEAVAKYGGATIRIAQQANDLEVVAAAVNDNDEVAFADEAPVAAGAAVGTPKPEAVSDAPQSLALNKRSLAYMQSVFGDISGLDLQESDRLGIAQALNTLRGESTRRPLEDFTTQFQLLLAGLRDAEIGAHLQKKPASVATGFSSAMRRIKEQPGYSPEVARQALLARLARGDADDAPAVVEHQPPVEAEEEVIDDEYEEAVPAVEARQFKETIQTGRLQGAVRLQLRKTGRDHTVELGETRLKELIDQVFSDGTLPSAVQEAYMEYLATGVPEFGNVALKQCMSMMPDAIAAIIGEAGTATVLPITTPTHHHRPAVSFSPANMPQKQPVLSFVPPRTKGATMAPSPEHHEPREVLPLVEAAYNESAMSAEAWYKAAYTYIADEASAQLGLTPEQGLGLWNAVHFGKSDTHKLRPPETKAALNALQAVMEAAPDTLWQHYPELQACLRKLVNPFPPQSLGAIQRSLRANQADVSDGAAQRYVVAAISELLRDWRGEATA